MKSFLNLDGCYLPESISLMLSSGRRNCEQLTDSLELILSVLDRPMQSTFWLQYSSDRTSGLYPSPKTFPSILDNHFKMKFVDFLRCEFSVKDFENFEEECLQLCALLEFDQVYRSFAQMLYICEFAEMIEN